MESRKAYGYYGTGYTGEKKTRSHVSGYYYREFDFTVKEPTGECVVAIKAIDHEHALKQIKKYVKENGFTLLDA